MDRYRLGLYEARSELKRSVHMRMTMEQRLGRVRLLRDCALMKLESVASGKIV